MKESDWKVFKEIKENAIEVFCETALNDFREAMDKEGEDVHNRYLLNFKLVKSRDKKMSLSFDVHSRFRAPLQLIAIRDEGLADEKLVAKLSDEFREQIEPKKSIDNSITKLGL